MGVIEDFVSEYEREIDFWEAAARTASGLLETELASSGLRAIVTSRAKSVDRLVEKLRVRDRRTPYASVSAIREDIVDLAGVRVALYFPGQMDEAERIIQSTLHVNARKTFPAGKVPGADPDGSDVAASQSVAVHLPRFSGYGARHFRVHIPESRLNQDQERYASALIEVQVASVLMHAWSEVEHDLVYKPLEGALSPSEYALLDQLNGLVLAGEIALEQLQKAGDERLAAAKTPFRDHYELAEFLRTQVSALGIDLTEATLGRVDVLFRFLTDEREATASYVEPYVGLLEQDFEKRPVADQLADLMLSGNPNRYEAYSRAMAEARRGSSRRLTVADVKATAPETIAIGEFMAAWILFEALLRNLSKSSKPVPPGVMIRRLVAAGILSPVQQEELAIMRELRNHVVHGKAGEVPLTRLSEATAWLRDITATIEDRAPEDGRSL
ncbi:GTP pyrophosphokinase [Arthrobacter globiformis]|uniref:RelA/SpoT domain-containing protein n=1 Tax=Arthrobacter globiformis TaxID=1665 RepID=A0A328HGH7_ARTGO|nr:RelA/SpoT domain-containing protein [Arthrobacter globiformis]RAM37231.1 hypothetical protein DBZ45_10405 [Arthrobacter globiformis]